MSDTYTGPLPVPTPESRPFWDAAKQHRLSIPYCNSCARSFFYPRPLCPHCLGADLDWRDASGRARLISYVVPQRPPRNFRSSGPFVIGIVELAEGPRMMSNIVGVEAKPQQLSCDMPLEVVFEDVTAEITLPLFRPSSGAAGRP
jgi:uncharacterized protein